MTKSKKNHSKEAHTSNDKHITKKKQKSGLKVTAESEKDKLSNNISVATPATDQKHRTSSSKIEDQEQRDDSEEPKKVSKDKN